MKTTSVLKALTLTLLFASRAELALHAQATQPYQGVVGRSLAESKEWWPELVKAPTGAPNVVWILLDDVAMALPAHSAGSFRLPRSTAWPKMAYATRTSIRPRSAPPPAQPC